MSTPGRDESRAIELLATTKTPVRQLIMLRIGCTESEWLHYLGCATRIDINAVADKVGHLLSGCLAPEPRTVGCIGSLCDLSTIRQAGAPHIADFHGWSLWDPQLELIILYPQYPNITTEVLVHEIALSIMWNSRTGHRLPAFVMLGMLWHISDLLLYQIQSTTSASLRSRQVVASMSKDEIELALPSRLLRKSFGDLGWSWGLSIHQDRVSNAVAYLLVEELLRMPIEIDQFTNFARSVLGQLWDIGVTEDDDPVNIIEGAAGLSSGALDDIITSKLRAIRGEGR